MYELFCEVHAQGSMKHSLIIHEYSSLIMLQLFKKELHE